MDLVGSLTIEQQFLWRIIGSWSLKILLLFENNYLNMAEHFDCLILVASTFWNNGALVATFQFFFKIVRLGFW